MKHRQFILKVIRIRKRLILNGHSRANAMQCFTRMRKMENWLSFFPNASEENMRKFFLRHTIDILYLIPGERCTAHEKLLKEFNELYATAKEKNREPQVG